MNLSSLWFLLILLLLIASVYRLREEQEGKNLRFVGITVVCWAGFVLIFTLISEIVKEVNMSDFPVISEIVKEVNMSDFPIKIAVILLSVYLFASRVGRRLERIIH